MLTVLLLVLNLSGNGAWAQVTCSPANDGAKEKYVAACGDEHVPAYTQKDQKLQSLTLLFENNQRGFERHVVIKNPGLTLAQINDGTYTQNSKVQQAAEKIQKEWSLKEVKAQVFSFTFDKKTSLFASADLKNKLAASKLTTQVRRGVASESPMAGGIRGVKDEKSK